MYLHVIERYGRSPSKIHAKHWRKTREFKLILQSSYVHAFATSWILTPLKSRSNCSLLTIVVSNNYVHNLVYAQTIALRNYDVYCKKKH
jgi:hypothetical protein